MAQPEDPFKIFVNTELPKRFSTEIDATTVRPGFVPITTGVGLGLDLVDPMALLNIGLITNHGLAINSDGTVTLPHTPLGGVVLDIALVLLKDGTYLEVIGVHVTGNTLTFLPLDYMYIKDIAESVSVTYVGSLVE